jgi:TetR/AcrR family transcriptional regulator
MTKNQGKEKKILEAARKVFMRKGMAGARMQEIADEAGINKALLHYYFRSKDKLFQKIFEETLEKISFSLEYYFSQDSSIFEKLQKLIDAYTDVLLDNPYLPMFVLNEINQNPDRIQKMFEKNDIVGELMKFITQLMSEINNGKIRPIHPSHLIVNLMGLLIFPFAVKPMIAPMFKEHIGINYEDLLAERKKVVYDFVYNAIKIDDNGK